MSEIGEFAGESPAEGKSLEQAMLVLLGCLTDPLQASLAFETIGSWLDENRDPVKLATLEAYSEQLLGSLLAAHLSDQRGAATDDEAPRDDVEFIELTPSSDREDVTPLQAFLAMVDPLDRKRLQELASGAGDQPEMLLRLAGDGGPTDGGPTDGSPTRLCHVTRRSNTISEDLVGKSPHNLGATFLEVRHERLSMLEATESALRASFRITMAEILVIRGLVQGERPRDIAARHGKSYETVRTQIRSIGTKLGGSTHSEIVSVVRAADDLTLRSGLTGTDETDNASTGSKRLWRARLVSAGDGRSIEYDAFGAADGQTLVYFHDFLGGRHWPADGKAAAARNGYRVISASRAGFARSSAAKRGGARALQAHVADYAAVVEDAEGLQGDGPLTLFAEGSGMSAAYNFALAFPERVSRIVGLNAMPPIEGRWTIPHCAPGVYRNGALAALYAPKTIRLLGRLGLKRVAMSNTRKSLGEVLSVHPDIIAETDSDFDAYMKANMADANAGDGDGVAVDCTYMAHDWARRDENLNTRPEVVLLINRDFPFIGDAPAERFCAQIGARLERIPTSYARRLFEPDAVFRALRSA